MWLPDDLAERYSTRTPRVPYNQLFKKSENFDPIAFARWGRGVSYHDLALAIGVDPEKLPVISCKELFFRNKTGPKRGVARRPDRRFENFIHALHPEIHDGFFLPSLDLILQKPPEIKFSKPGLNLKPRQSLTPITSPKPLRKYTEGCLGMPLNRHRSLSDP
jgi:hypothetical protein